MKIYRIETYLNIHFYQDCDCFSFYKQIKEIQKYMLFVPHFQSVVIIDPLNTELL